MLQRAILFSAQGLAIRSVHPLPNPPPPAGEGTHRALPRRLCADLLVAFLKHCAARVDLRVSSSPFIAHVAEL